MIRNYHFFKKPSVVLGIYLFIILLFTFLYWYLNISFNQREQLSQLCFSDSLYFSLVTITTLGYGDISPSGGLGKLLAGSEAVFGILILGLYLNSLSHNLAIRYQEKLKEKESEMAIKLICGPNWYYINAYHWHLVEVDKALSKVQLLQQNVSDPTPEQLTSFKDSLKQFNNTINLYTLKHLKEDKAKSIIHLNKFFGMVDPLEYGKLLYHINILNSKELHVMHKRFIDVIEDKLAIADKRDTALSATSSNLYYIVEWLKTELESMEYITGELNDIIGPSKTKPA